MNLIIKFIFIVGAGIVIYYLFVTIPTMKQLLVCYDNTVQNFDTIEIESRKQGWTEERRCQIRYTQLEDTEKCLQEVNVNSTLPVSMDAIFPKFLAIFRPNITELPELKKEHDMNCQNYPDTMFNPYEE